MHLYLDTTEKLVIGLLDDEFQWINYSEEGIRNASSKIQSIILDKLNSIGKKISDIESVFQASGPGSYTGMRVSEGLCQVLEWHNKKIYSFYHFEVPEFYGVESGTWTANAYKGDVFIYEWDNLGKEEYRLIKIEEIASLSEVDFFSHYVKEPFEEVKSNKLTSEMIKANPQKLFIKLKKENIRREPYYYRPIEVEFTKPKKGRK